LLNTDLFGNWDKGLVIPVWLPEFTVDGVYFEVMFDVMGLGLVEVMRLVGLVWEMRLLEALLGLRERVCDGDRLGECGDTLL
jgi:hypothetical protein